MPPVRQNGYSQKRRANAERTFEAVIEVIYEAHVATGWLIEPFFQYVFRPSGGIPNPYNPVGVATRIGDAAVFGLTSVLKY